jgi:proteasome lid subunit RPN8/RPN11
VAALRIRIQPIQKPPPQPAIMPLESSRRWLSPHEVDGRLTVLSVFVTQSAYSHAVIHCASEPDYEVGGFLLGKWCRDVENGQQFVVAETALPARFTRQGSVYLTFTQDSLVDIHAKIDRDFPGKDVVGWYHTHPRMGIFLSHYDTWLHDHFFPEPWQIALVIEPHMALGGFFMRDADGSLDPSRYFGFYELDGAAGHSIVHWQNMQDLEEARHEGE